jgi:hypothetical protein
MTHHHRLLHANQVQRLQLKETNHRWENRRLKENRDQMRIIDVHPRPCIYYAMEVGTNGRDYRDRGADHSNRKQYAPPRHIR